MKTRVLALLIVPSLALSFGHPAKAQQGSGDSEIQVQGSLNIGTSGGSQRSGGVYVNYGRFFGDHQEVGGSVTATLVNDSDLMGFGGPFYRYNFGTGKTVPYVGAAVGTGFGKAKISSDALVSLEAGFRYFLDRRTAFSVAATDLYSTKARDFADSISITFGFSHLWGK